MKRSLLTTFAMALLVLVSARGFAQNTYTMVTSASGLEVGAQYLLVGIDDEGNAYAMSYQKSNNRHAVIVSENGGVVTATVATDPNSQTDPFEFTLGGSTGAWTIYDPLKEGYLYAAGGGNYLKTQTSLTDNGKWTISFDGTGGAIPVSNGGVEQCYMRFNFNNGSPLFGCYKESSSVNGLVYFFKAGSATPDPEPTNYPTAFNASVNGLDVTLNWIDAVGGQLPSKYLVLASTSSSVTLPQDGTSYPDNNLTRNVAYGTQTTSFENLSGNTNYYFFIFPYTNSGANIDYKTDGSYPTASAHTPDIIYLLNEDFEGDDLGVFTTVDMYGDQSWRNASYDGNKYATMNGYASGASHRNEDWLISPCMYGNYSTINLQFMTAKRYEGDDLALKISTDYDGVSEPTDFYWEDLTDMFDWSVSDYEWVESGSVNIANYAGQHFYIAFVYTSSDEASASWELDDVKIFASGMVSVADQSMKQLVVSPNPANGDIRFELASQAWVTVYDLSGRKVSESRLGAGVASMGVSSLESGVYFLSVRYADGKKEVARFVKL